MNAEEPRLRPADEAAGTGAAENRRLAAVATVALLVAVGGGVFVVRGQLSHGLGLAGKCGNGQVDPGEECDDGNPNNEDGCLPSCKLAVCGDGIVRPFVEDCDDGNKIEGDGCSSGCLVCPANAASFSSSDNGHCYWREDGAKSYSEAQATCSEKRGYLATYGTDVEWREVSQRLANQVQDGVWIGLRQEDRNGVRDFAWISGEQVRAAHWAIHEPRRSVGFDCAVQSKQGTWAAAACEEPRPFICERPRWSRFPRESEAYRRFAEKVTWQEAADSCGKHGARLVIFRTQAEQIRLSRRFAGPLWIGVRLDDKTGDFTWASGAPLGYRDFAPGEPNFVRLQHCVALDIDGRWYNRECGDRNRFVCQIP